MALDFSGLNRIAGADQKRDQAKDALRERGYTLVEGEPLPFVEETHPSSAPDMLEAWRMAYRIFTKYAPALRHAGATDGASNDEAVRITSEIRKEVNALYKVGGDAELLAVHVFGMLNDAWKKARGAKQPG